MTTTRTSTTKATSPAETGRAAKPAPGTPAPDGEETAAQRAPLPFMGLPIGHGALLRAIEKNTVRVDLPVVGELRLPPGDTLAWLGGLAALAVVGVLDWPVAAVIGAGHVLAHQNHLRLLKDFGEGLEQA